MKAMVPTLMGIPPPGMGSGAKAAGAAIPIAIEADAVKKDPNSAGSSSPAGKGQGAIEKVLCKIRQEQECARKKPKTIPVTSSYENIDDDGGGGVTNFMEFMKSVCGVDVDGSKKGDCTPSVNTAGAEPIDPLKVLESILNGQSTDDVEINAAAESAAAAEVSLNP